MGNSVPDWFQTHIILSTHKIRPHLILQSYYTNITSLHRCTHHSITPILSILKIPPIVTQLISTISLHTTSIHNQHISHQLYTKYFYLLYFQKTCHLSNNPPQSNLKFLVSQNTKFVKTSTTGKELQHYGQWRLKLQSVLCSTCTSPIGFISCTCLFIYLSVSYASYYPTWKSVT
jgi:hypothetical protein